MRVVWDWNVYAAIAEMARLRVHKWNVCLCFLLGLSTFALKTQVVSWEN
jgi:hypothetical protein